MRSVVDPNILRRGGDGNFYYRDRSGCFRATCGGGGTKRIRYGRGGSNSRPSYRCSDHDGVSDLGKPGCIVLADADAGHTAVIALLAAFRLHPRVPSRPGWQRHNGPCSSGGCGGGSSSSSTETSCAVVHIHPRLRLSLNSFKITTSIVPS